VRQHLPGKQTSWETFLKSDWGAIAATDFFSVEVLKPRGWCATSCCLAEFHAANGSAACSNSTIGRLRRGAAEYWHHTGSVNGLATAGVDSVHYGGEFLAVCEETERLALRGDDSK